ncbi:hypothetical protein RJG79_08540 [Mycoplasmatota bacterium WC44]
MKSHEYETSLALVKKKQMKELERKIESTVNLMIEDNDVKVQKILMQKMNQMTDDKELLEEELRTMVVGTEVEEVSIDRIKDVIVGLNEYMVKNPDDRIRALVRKFVDKVEVDNVKIVVWFKLDYFFNYGRLDKLKLRVSKMVKSIYKCSNRYNLEVL